MIPQRIYEYARSAKSVSSELALQPHETPGEIAHRLYKNAAIEATGHSAKDQAKDEEADLEKALKCGNWGETKPTALFLKVNTSSQTPW
jgi:hypothetical protein